MWQIQKRLSFSPQKNESLILPKLKKIARQPFTFGFTLYSDILQVTIVSNESGYIAVRHQSFEGGKKYGNGIYTNENQFIKILEEGYGYLKSDTWLGQKNFKEYGKTEDQIVKSIISEIESLKTDFDKVK